MIDLNFNKNNCTGCGACAALCPVSAISMKSDSIGYLYPSVDYNLCVKCRLCVKKCPEKNILNSEKIDRIEQFAFSARTNDNDLWSKSSSGGAFTSICNAFADNETAIFGAKYDNNLNVIHDYIIGINGIEVFQKSKYVHSYIDKSIYHKVKNFLIHDKRVVFSGVSCQIAGLKSFLGKEYPNLLCIDLVCMGSGSPLVFKTYLKEIESKYKKRIIKYSFREKKIRRGCIDEFLVKIEFSDNTSMLKSKDLYNTSFIEGLHTQPSCSSCPYKNKIRLGDITIADFKRRESVYPFDKDLRNLSAVIINTQLGRTILKDMLDSMYIRMVPMNVLEKNIVPLTKNTPENSNRKLFIKEFIDTFEVASIVKKYKRKSSILMKIWTHLPDRFRGIVKIIIK